jgi:hypothetical protein
MHCSKWSFYDTGRPVGEPLIIEEFYPTGKMKSIRFTEKNYYLDFEPDGMPRKLHNDKAADRK